MFLLIKVTFWQTKACLSSLLIHRNKRMPLDHRLKSLSMDSFESALGHFEFDQITSLQIYPFSLSCVFMCSVSLFLDVNSYLCLWDERPHEVSVGSGPALVWWHLSTDFPLCSLWTAEHKQSRRHFCSEGFSSEGDFGVFSVTTSQKKDNLIHWQFSF